MERSSLGWRGGGFPRPARRGGGDDTEAAGGEELARREGDLAGGVRGEDYGLRRSAWVNSSRMKIRKHK
jgi:hypothetical protein